MKNRKVKAKKGMTLIEVIISVTLLSILIVPISGFMLSSLNNNISSQKKQEASYIGQKILEELKAYDYINLKSDNQGDYFELLDGDRISKINNNSFEGKFNRDIYGLPNSTRNLNKYNVELIINEDSVFKYDNINNLDLHNDADYRIDFINENRTNYIIDNNNPQKKASFSENIKLDIGIENNNEFNLSIYDKNSSTEIKDLKNTKSSNKIVLYITSDYKSDNNVTNIEVNNNTGETIFLYVIKEKGATEEININSNIGRIVVSEEEEITINTIGKLYKYTVKVAEERNKNKILFQGEGSNNININ